MKEIKELYLKIEHHLHLPNCMGKVQNTQTDKAKNIDVVMLIYNLIEYGDNCSNALVILWQYYRDESNAALTESCSFKFKVRITSAPDDDNKKMMKQEYH